MDQQPSTSSAPKRARYEEENSNGKCVCDFNNCSIESLIVEILSYFSHENNWHVESLERSFIPQILGYSEIFKGGRIADFSRIKNISIPQAKTLLKLFRYCSEMKMDHMIAPRLQLYYMADFKFMKKLTITIEDDDNFDRMNDSLSIKILKIKATNNSFRYDPIAQIINVSPFLEYVSLKGGLITYQTMHLIHNLNITYIKLSNTKFTQESKIAMLAYLEKNKNLSTLKLILTESFVKNEIFYEISYYFFRAFSNQYPSLQHLSFTLCQYSEQNLIYLLNLPNLKTLKIFYSAQYATKNFINLINVLRQLNNAVEITLVEYYSPPPKNEIHTQTYLNGLTLQSARIKMILEESAIGHKIKILTCHDYE